MSPNKQHPMHLLQTLASKRLGNRLEGALRWVIRFSPSNVVVEESRRSAAEFLTSLCAIIGGVFTVLGLFDSVVYHSVKVVQKLELGKMN